MVQEDQCILNTISQTKLIMQAKNEKIRKLFVECKQKLFPINNNPKLKNQSKTQRDQ
jgi:hypothetical protein